MNAPPQPGRADREGILASRFAFWGAAEGAAGLPGEGRNPLVSGLVQCVFVWAARAAQGVVIGRKC